VAVAFPALGFFSPRGEAPERSEGDEGHFLIPTFPLSFCHSEGASDRRIFSLLSRLPLEGKLSTDRLTDEV